MKEYYKKKELIKYGYENFPIYTNRIDIPKGYLSLVAKLQVDGEIRKDDLVGFHLKSKREYYPLFKTKNTVEIIESDSLPEGYRRLEDNERAKPEALRYMNGFNLPITKKEIPIQEKTEHDNPFFYNQHSLHTLKGFFTKDMLNHFHIPIETCPIVSFYKTKYTFEPLYKVAAPYKELTVIYDFNYESYNEVPGY
jgi:hypothetical protein